MLEFFSKNKIFLKSAFNFEFFTLKHIKKGIFSGEKRFVEAKTL